MFNMKRMCLLLVIFLLVSSVFGSAFVLRKHRRDLSLFEGNPFLHRNEYNSYYNNPFHSSLNQNPVYKCRSAQEILTKNPFFHNFPSRNSPTTTPDQNGYWFYENNDRRDYIACGTSIIRVRQLIVNGDEFEEGTYPWLAALFTVKTAKPNFICGGTLISQKHVVTAGHCVIRNNVTVEAKNLFVVLGKFDIQNASVTDSSSFKIETVYSHPDYKVLSADGDIAVLVLQRKVSFSTLIKPACLWNGINNNLDDIVGVRGTVAGWGKNENGTVSLDRPREVKIPVVSQETCLRSHMQFASVTSVRTFCAGTKGGEGPCNGDSGSGLMINRNGQYTLRGIVSLSLGSDSVVNGCDLTSYVVFTDVSKFTSWLNSVLK